MTIARDEMIAGPTTRRATRRHGRRRARRRSAVPGPSPCSGESLLACTRPPRVRCERKGFIVRQFRMPIACVAFLLSAQPAAANLIVNGSFETPGCSDRAVQPGSTLLDGWLVTRAASTTSEPHGPASTLPLAGSRRNPRVRRWIPGLFYHAWPGIPVTFSMAGNPLHYDPNGIIGQNSTSRGRVGDVGRRWGQEEARPYSTRARASSGQFKARGRITANRLRSP